MWSTAGVMGVDAEQDDGFTWITGDVSIPQKLLDAHAERKLVIFVGAGASVDPPSSLPLFDRLAKELANLARIPFKADVALDYFLGLMPLDFALHEHARDLIASKDSTPNSTHRAIVRLADAGGTIRIVTTNFDDHLMTAAQTEGVAIGDRWTGPAVPLGGDFAGIVHLHGSVLREPRELILTDADFGRAYVTHAWATRFLLAMFREFTVLFVGYSHDDPIMRYLALGLPSATPRYVLTDSARSNDPKWARLGVTTIGYPVTNHDHGALVAALDTWNHRARMGQFEHQARMREIVEAGPQLTPVDRDYLDARIRTPAGAREFSDSCQNVDSVLRVEWLIWAEATQEFQALFSGGDVTESSAILGDWFCRSFVAEPELSGAALQTVQRLGQGFSTRLFESACWSVDGLEAMDAVAGRRWRALLATSIHGHSAPVSFEGILMYQPGERIEHISVMRAALQPYLSLKRRWLVKDPDDSLEFPDAEVVWNGEHTTLGAHVVKFAEGRPAGDTQARSVLEGSLNAAYDLLDAYHGSREWDPLGFGRSAIEPHAQDEFSRPIDAVIDGLRAFGENSLPVLPNLIEEWWSQGRGLFQRLALHLLARAGSRTSDAKLGWLLDRSLLFELNVKHEVYQVLGRALPNASAPVKQRLLDDALLGPRLLSDAPDAQRHTAYSMYNLLVWLTTADPDWADASFARTEIQAANPDFAPREHPDFDRWMSGGTWGGKLPMEPEEFVRRWDEDPRGAIDDILARDFSERTFGEPDWDDALALIKQAAQKRPDLGGPLWERLDQSEVELARVNDIRRAVIEGWSSADLGESAPEAIRYAASHIGNDGSSEVIADLLAEQIRKSIDSEESPIVDLMRQLATDLWRAERDRFVAPEGYDPLSFAPLYLNSWPGNLAQYWLSEIDRRWRQNRASWAGLNEQERDALIGLLGDSATAVDATVPALAGQLFFIFAADRQFAVEHLFPLFRNDETSTLAWNPFLHNPRYNDKLLSSGFTEIVIAQWARLESLGQDDLRRHFFGVVTSIVTLADVTAEQRSALLEASVLAANGTYAADFASEVVHFISEESIDGAMVYSGWLGSHLASRAHGLPRIAQPEELARWADAVPYVGEHVPDVIALFHGRGVGLGQRFNALSIPDHTLHEFGAQLIAHYAERVRNTPPGDRRVAHRVRELVKRFRSTLGDATTQPLLDAAAAQGFLTRGTY